MFTGIVETVGVVSAREPGLLVIQPRRSLQGLAIGESVSVDGVCLTVDRLNGARIIFRLLPETMRLSTLGGVKVSDRVNLERSLRVGDRLGGHLLLGHVDGRGTVSARRKAGKALTLEIEIPKRMAALLVPKGPIAIDGVSLTLDSKIQSDRFKVHLISHTLSVATLGQKPVGATVNLELDLVAKYLRGML